MKFNEINKKINNYFGISEIYAKQLYDLILDNNIKNILEIGFAHGKSTCYMAAALDESKDGTIKTIDIKSARNQSPNIIELSTSLGLNRYITPIFSEVSSNWELHNMIIKQTVNNHCNPIFDFCFIDAFHSWEMAGMDFFLVEKLLLPGGWIIFDDLMWSFNTSPSWKNLEKTKNMPSDFKEAKQVYDVFKYLVQQHPNFGNFRIENNFGFAKKKCKE